MDILVRPLVYIVIFISGYILKKTGYFKVDDSKVLSKIVLNIVLPAVAVNSFVGENPPPSYFLLSVFGIVCASIPIIIVILLTKKMTLPTRAPTIINTAGFNVGAFSIPFVQAIFASQGVVVACMFDAGNALIMTGGSYAIVSTVLGVGGDGSPQSAKDVTVSIVKRLFKSIPFSTYIVVMIFLALEIEIPMIVGEFTGPIANAGGFLSMLMLGIMFEIRFEAQFIKSAIFIIISRLVFSTIFSVSLFFLTEPIFDLQTRQVLAMILFAPSGSFSPVFTRLCNGDEELSSFAASLSIFISTVIIFTMATQI